MRGPSVVAVVARSLRAHGLVQPARSMAEALVGAAAVYGTSPTSHLGLAARLDGYTPESLERLRLEERSVLRVPGMRGSVFLAPRALVSAHLGLSRPRTARVTLRNEGVGEAALERLMRLAESVLTDESLTAGELRKRLGADDPGGPHMTLVLRAMAGEGRVVATEPVSGVRASAYRYASMAAWAPDLGPPLPTGQALAVMAPIWMRANGPGSVADLAWWAGVTRASAKAALAAMGARVIEVDGLDDEQWATDEVIEGLVTAQTAGVVRFLAVWDAWLMARRERSRILHEAHRPLVVDKSGNVTNTITLDGKVVGVWDVDGETLLVAMHEGEPPAGLEEAAARLNPVVGWTKVVRLEPRAMPHDRQNAFRAPLR
jgi:hypothetical protein